MFFLSIFDDSDSSIETTVTDDKEALLEIARAIAPLVETVTLVTCGANALQYERIYSDGSIGDPFL